MPSRKFLFYMPALLGGGAERVFALLASEASRRGHDVIFAVDYEATENLDYLAPGIRQVTLPAGHVRAVIGLAALLRRERPDVSFSGLGVANLKHMLAALATGRHRRAVISFHGFFESENRLLSRLGNHGAPIFTRLCGRAVAVSDGLRNELVRRYHASSSRTVRIYNPVYSPVGWPAVDAADLAVRPPQILFVGRMHPDKDLPTLLRAFAKVSYPEAVLELVGDGPVRPELERLAASLGIAGRVSFAGYLKDPAAAYRRSRVLALTSRLESFGNVVAEALAHGLPVVSTAAAGPAEILGHGEFGTLVPIGDHEAMARALDAALLEPGVPAARQARASLFSIEAATDAYLAMAEEILRETSA
ncbi:glycosyltransferase [Rhabdaerophilum sp. SD176]|uniref:glycosyltransferase n=1 Tax=Rhabdaerophilum sp. SD176 TaxID=2983548 RepID=UPI0024DF8C7A|nr:glycosyltransferase [Rhabdaerophilum sp. SD176]